MEKLADVKEKITGLDKTLIQETQDRLDNLTKPQGSLGKLESLAKQIVASCGRPNPEFKNKVIFTLASDHGVTEESVSAFPKEVTAQMVYNFLSNGAAINVLARHTGCRVVVIDMGIASEIKVNARTKDFKRKKINFGTKNFVKGPAMTREEAQAAIEAGIETLTEELNSGLDIIGVGEMGIGNTTAATAIISVFTKKKPADIAGRGTGLDDQGLKRKIEVIEKALKINNPDSKDAIDVLSKVGGFEIGGIAGIVLAASANKIPVVIDGLISSAGALIAYEINPKVKDYLIASHLSCEKGHRACLDYMGLEPLLDFNMRLGEGTGAALAIGIAEASIKILTQMATFETAGVSEKS